MFFVLQTYIITKGGFCMRLSELSGKEIVDVKRAERLGVLGQTDLEINEQDGQITALIIPSVKWFGLRKQGQDIRVPWKRIQKIGSDMIILDVPEEIGNSDD
ncbi:uncharacterized protein S101395_03055 [Bacillus sonorensis]|nr:uncharacterized protein S101395_03055 [Bacillus sonorensis]